MILALVVWLVVSPFAAAFVGAFIRAGAGDE
jgi:hypothetical protein